MEMIMLKNVKTLDCLDKTMYMGRAILVKTEAIETIRVIINTPNQVRITRPNITLKLLILIAKPNNTPKVVAIPLPPLNLKNTVQL